MASEDEFKNEFDNELEDKVTMSSFLDRVIRALTVNDAPRLRDLLRMADSIEAQTQKQEVLQVISRRELLLALLNETACNLRLLQRAYGRVRGSDLWRDTGGTQRRRFS
jgi:hypothetical protein